MKEKEERCICGENQMVVFLGGKVIGCQCMPGYEWERPEDPTNHKCVEKRPFEERFTREQAAAGMRGPRG